MSAPGNFDISGWTVQAQSLFYDGNYPFSVRPPINSNTIYMGIPNPTFTTTELNALGYSPWPYDPRTLVAPTAPVSWTGDVAGFYFIQAGGTNVGNGFPGDARAKLPNTLAAGDVVVISGDVADGGTVTANGTSGSPCWIISDTTTAGRFIAPSDPSGQYTWSGTHLLIDGVDMFCTGRTGTITRVTSMSFWTLRNAAWYGDRTSSQQGIGWDTGSDHCMAYKANLYDWGNWDSAFDDNRHGIKVSGANNFWVIDCQLHDITNDGVQVGDTNTPTVQWGFLAGNTCYNNAQTGLWTKNAYFLFFSQNDVSAHIDAPAGAGDYVSIGGQYDFGDVWWLGNTCHGLGGGLNIASPNATQAQGLRYVVSNLFYDITNPNFDFTNPHSAHTITDRNSTQDSNIINNTIVNCHAGIASPYSGKTVLGNAIDTVTAANALQLFLAIGGASAVDYNAYAGTAAVDYNSIAGFSALTAAGLETNGVENATLTYQNAAGQDYTPAVGSDALETNALHAVYATFEAKYGFSIFEDMNGTTRPVGLWDRGAIERP